MPSRYPARPRAHHLEEQSRRHLESTLPDGWWAEKPQRDYGVDVRVEVVPDGVVQGIQVLVQLKAGETPSRTEVESVRLAARTYRYIWDSLPVAILVKYIESEGAAYWVFFRDIEGPPEGQQTFTVRIPRANRLSVDAWEEIAAYAREVRDRKLDANRRAGG